jgi:hypothetical protein
MGQSERRRLNFLAIQFAFAKSFAKMSEIRQLPRDGTE